MFNKKLTKILFGAFHTISGQLDKVSEIEFRGLGDKTYRIDSRDGFFGDILRKTSALHWQSAKQEEEIKELKKEVLNVKIALTEIDKTVGNLAELLRSIKRKIKKK